MSDYLDEDDNTTDQPTGKDLRAQLQAALGRESALKGEVSAYKAKESVAVAATVLEANGYKAGLAKWAAKDDVDLSDASALAKWVQENPDIATGFKSASEVPQTDEAETEDPEDTSVQDAWGTLAIQRGQQQPASTSKLDSFLAEIPEDASKEQVMALARKRGL